MANTSAGGPVTLSWAGKQVRIEEVEMALSALWKMSADNLRTGANVQVRTSVLNLVICTPDVESAQHASKLLRELSSTHIARATIIVLDQRPEAPDALTSWITLRCFSMISDVMRHCFEQTTILTSGRTAHTLDSMLPSLLKAHLPVYLWWLGAPRCADDATFQKIAALCQRVIIDSATFAQPEQDLHTLARFCQRTPGVAISDLNWGRLTLWRQLVAQFFDVSEYLPFLAGIERIDIAYAAAPTAEPEPTGALLLAGWLKARLKMRLATYHEQQPPPNGNYRWQLLLPAASSATLLQIRPHIQADLHPGSIYLVRLTCKAAQKQATFTIQRGANSDYVLTSVESVQQPHPMRTVNLPNRHEERDLLRNELEIMVHDLSFEQTLQELVRLIGGS
ncbi:MAG TPA: glucose-6-phosphate dehydrogenase assembly protein OpcA [Ktedonobacteraceae bacterium]|jgi:glucose-6-phosphate dehydrogenase assembly protein OpcA